MRRAADNAGTRLIAVQGAALRGALGAALGVALRGALGVALLAALAGCSPAPDRAIGVILPLEGRLKQGGHALQAGIDLALAELPPERRPRVLVADNGGDSRRTTQVFDHLVEQGASVILGPLTTDDVAAAAIAARTHGIACVAPAATGASPDGALLRLCFGDEEAGAALAAYARDTLRLERLALVMDLQSGYSMGLGDAFGREFQRRGGRIAGRAWFHGGQDNALSVLDEAAALDPDGVLLAAYAPDIVRMVNGARDERVGELILLGGDAFNGDGVREALAGRVHGAYHTRHFDPDSPDPVVHEFVERYRAAQHETPSDLAALGYDAARAVFSTFDPALDGPALRARLLQLRDFPGVTGALTLDARGAAVGKPILLEQLLDPEQPAVLGRIDAEGAAPAEARDDR
jgi:branched-chain amino acid transport system substrate-binding protein